MIDDLMCNGVRSSHEDGIDGSNEWIDLDNWIIKSLYSLFLIDHIFLNL